MVSFAIRRSGTLSGLAIVEFEFWVLLTAFATVLLANWWFARGYLATLTLDHPNKRKLHSVPKPRTGGISMHFGIGLACVIIAPDLPVRLWIAVGILIGISLLNDIREVPAFWRLGVHLLAAAVLASDVLFDVGLPFRIVSVFTLGWMANLYNFMDGSDGLAGGMTLIGFSFYGAGAIAGGHMDFALVNLSIAAAAAAFLVSNFHPARVFMGDSGSVPLGFLAAALGAIGWLQHVWNWWFPVLVFSPFIVDATVTLVRRFLAGEKVWRAHRDHYYQRLVLLGWGHRKTAFAEYGLMLACGLLAISALVAPAQVQLAVLGAVSAGYLVLIAAVSRTWHRHHGVPWNKTGS